MIALRCDDSWHGTVCAGDVSGAVSGVLLARRCGLPKRARNKASVCLATVLGTDAGTFFIGQQADASLGLGT